MPLHSTDAIVIGGHDLAEADRIVVFYTATAGKVRAVAEGARRIRTRFGETSSSSPRDAWSTSSDPTRPCTR